MNKQIIEGINRTRKSVAQDISEFLKDNDKGRKLDPKVGELLFMIYGFLHIEGLFMEDISERDCN